MIKTAITILTVVMLNLSLTTCSTNNKCGNNKTTEAKADTTAKSNTCGHCGGTSCTKSCGAGTPGN
jgi:hypothetical protein